LTTIVLRVNIAQNMWMMKQYNMSQFIHYYPRAT